MMYVFISWCSLALIIISIVLFVYCLRLKGEVDSLESQVRSLKINIADMKRKRKKKIKTMVGQFNEDEKFKMGLEFKDVR